MIQNPTSPSTSPPRIQLNTRLWPLLVLTFVALQLFAPYQGWKILLVGLGATWALGYLWARALARGLRVTREKRFGWAQVGDRLEERFTLINDGWLPALWVEVRDQSTLPGYTVSRATGVGAFSLNTWHTQGVCARRGLFTLGPTLLRCGDPFGLYTVSISDPAMVSLIVMPPVVPLPPIEIAAGGRAGEGRQRAAASEPTVSATRVREYLPGDNLHWIHWRASARHDKLLVRQFDHTPAGDWWIALDLNQAAQVGEGQQSTLEHGVILAASLAAQGLRAGRAVGLMAHGESLSWITPQVGEGQRWEILRALTLAQSGAHSLAESLARAQTAFRQASSLIIITADVSGAWVDTLWPLLRRGVAPTILLLAPRSFGSDADAQPLLNTLDELGIAHQFITRDLLDRPELRAGRQGQWEWRVSGTGRAIAVRQPGDLTWKPLT